MANHPLRPRAGRYDLRPEYNFDGIATGYVVAIVIWSIILVAGLALLVLLRHLTFIRIRNVTLSAMTVATIHVYLVLVFLVYLTNGKYPCGLEYWAMSTWFPFGVALFQAQNVLLLDISIRQKRMVLEPDRRPSKNVVAAARRGRGPAAWLRSWREMNLVKRTYVGIGIGMVVQTVVTLFVYLGSRRFHPWGLFSTSGSAAHCRTGWEWLPTALWQAVWTFIYGPFILWKIRHIDDVHRWRLQTTLAIIFSLPGLPLVIAAIHAPAFRKINRTWTPPMWFAPGLIVMEFVTVFFPLLEAYEARYLRKLNLSALDDWEKRRNDTTSLSSDSLKHTSSIGHAEKNGGRDMYSMHSLERVLAQDPTELLHFAATKEFTGENIVFLTEVRDWKRAWDRAAASEKQFVGAESQQRLYRQAVELFLNNVCLLTAQFPVNIESKIYVALEKVFRPDTSVAAAGAHSKSVVTPFDDRPNPASQTSLTDAQRKAGLGAKDAETSVRVSCVSSVDIPRGFDRGVFDAAEASVKYMVLTNTWARYIDACEAVTLRSSSNGSAASHSSGSTLLSLFRKKAVN